MYFHLKVLKISYIIVDNCAITRVQNLYYQIYRHTAEVSRIIVNMYDWTRESQCISIGARVSSRWPIVRHAAWVDWKGVPAVGLEPRRIANVRLLWSCSKCFRGVKPVGFVYCEFR